MKRRRIILPALVVGGLIGAAIAQEWIPVWLGVGAAVLVGLAAAALLIRARSRAALTKE